jgi:hypothetical protein
MHPGLDERARDSFSSEARAPFVLIDVRVGRSEHTGENRSEPDVRRRSSSDEVQETFGMSAFGTNTIGKRNS